MSLSRESTVAEIVLEHPECAQLLQRHRIDFCCRGGERLDAACAEKGLDPAAVYADLEAEIQRCAGNEAPRDLRTLGLGELVKHIVAVHHQYLRRTLPFIGQLSSKVARVHGEHNPSLVALDVTFRALGDKLEAHLDDEEEELFPQLLAGKVGDAGVPAALEAMKVEHREVGAALEEIRALADDFKVPNWGCGSYRTLFAELERLEGDTLRHLHAENHVLAPRFTV